MRTDTIDWRKATLILIAGTALLRLIGAAAIGWGTGEAYYVASARALHLSYYDQPPMSLWITWAMMTLFESENVALLRLPFVVMFAGTTWLLYLVGARLHSPLAGFVTAVIVNASILFSLSIGSWVQPDAPMMLFWMATCLVLIEIYFGRGGERPYLYWGLAGLLLGLTFLSKYHAIFIVLGAGLFMVVNARQRRWLVHPAPYLGLMIAMAVFSPVLVWNAQNAWVSFGFQGGRALGEGGLRWDWLIRMVLGQILYITPWIVVPALMVVGKVLRRGPDARFPDTAPPGLAVLLVLIALPPIVFFTAVSLWADAQFHFHWQAPGYMMLFPLLGAWAADAMALRGRLVRAWLYGSAGATLAILVLLVSHAATGWGRQLVPGDWEDPTALQLPWTEVGTALESRGAFGEELTFFMGVDWINCGYLDTQVAGRAPLACIGPDPRNLAFTVDLDSLSGWSAYIVTRTHDPETVIAAYDDMFDTITPVDTVAIHRNGFPELVDLVIFHAEGFDPEATERFELLSIAQR